MTGKPETPDLTITACITGNLSVQHRPFYYVLAVSMGLYTLHMLVELTRGLVNFDGEDPDDPGEG